MPRDEDRELGAVPTAITSVVGEHRNREATQQIAMPDPKWTEGALPAQAQTLDSTYPQMIAPTPTVRQRARVLSRRVVHEYKKLPSRVRTAIVAIVSALAGLIVGLIIAPSGGGAGAASAMRVDDDLTKHAKRLEMPERDAVVRALTVGDGLAALMMLRSMTAKDHLAADPLALALRGRLALIARDGVDALDNFEAALTAQPKLADEPWFPAAAVQTFASNKLARTTALLGKLPKDETRGALGAACMDWQYRVRHGAQDALKALGGSCPDAVGAAIVDAYQAEKCDAARAVVQKLVPLAPTDERVAGALDAISRRPSVAGCVAELLPRK